MRKGLRDQEKMNMEGILERNRDREVDLEAVHPNVPDHIRNYDPEVDPEQDCKDPGQEIVDHTRNLFPEEDPFPEGDVNRPKGDQLPERDLLQENDPFLEEDPDQFPGKRDLCQEGDPEDQSQGLEDPFQDPDREDLYQDPEDPYLDPATDVRIRKNINLEVDQGIERDPGQSHPENLQNRKKGSIRSERRKVDQDRKEDLVPEIGSKLIK